MRGRREARLRAERLRAAGDQGRACSFGTFWSLSDPGQNSMCLRPTGNSGIQNSVTFVVSLRSTCSLWLPHTLHTIRSTARTRT